MPLDREVGPDPGQCVRWGPSSAQKGDSPPPNFHPMSIVAKRSPIPATAELLFIFYVSLFTDEYGAVLALIVCNYCVSLTALYFAKSINICKLAVAFKCLPIML